MIVGIDASRNRSGGAKAHLIGILNEGPFLDYGIDEVHVWSYKDLLSQLPDSRWLIKHSPPELECSLLRQIAWQRFRFPREATAADCSIVLNTDAGTVSGFRPSITMSRDMLSYEPGEMQRFGWSKARWRLLLLRWMQNRSLRNCDGAIFLTKYASEVIQQSCGNLANIAYIPHGVGTTFRNTNVSRRWPEKDERPLECVYVSPIWLFKHQWMVVRAIAELRKKGYRLRLTLIGGGEVHAKALLEKEIADSDPTGEFVQLLGHVPHSELPARLAEADFCIFASSCENMPNTLVESMAVGLPIVSSDRGPMPEVLQNGGLYFDPEDPTSIAAAIEELLKNHDKRVSLASQARKLSQQYSWARCADETFSFIAKTAECYKRGLLP